MAHATVISWTCDRCGARGKLLLDSSPPREACYVAAVRDHGVELSNVDPVALGRHLDSFHFRVKRNGPRPTQLEMYFEEDQTDAT